MARKKNSHYKKNIEKKEIPQETNTPAKSNRQPEKSKIKIFIGFVFVLTLICYFPSLFNDFIPNWDDGGYILEYEPVHEINAENIATIWTVFYKGNYHPITTMYYMFEYAMVGDSPFLYHLNNLIFHLLNVLLVFWLIYIVSKKNLWVAAIVSALFGIHPMHVESVAWISERKDVLYTFFYLLSIICYLKYLNQKNNATKYYVYAIILFCFSLLSKSAAVTLPVILFLIDFYLKRGINKKVILEKLPFFAGALLFGLLAVFSQDEKGAIQNLAPMFSIFERMAIVSYSIIVYIGKMIIPYNFSAMYAYPDRIDGHLPMEFLLSIIPVVIFLGLTVWAFLKKNYDIVFGVSFFFITISLVLQILPVGGAILAERYTYVPYIGLFFIIGKAYAYIEKRKSKNIITLTQASLIAIALLFSWISMNRIQDWNNGEKLFLDVAKKNPTLPFAYNNLGYYYYKYEKNNDKALVKLDKCLSLDPNFHSALSTRGVIHFNRNNFKQSLIDFSGAIKHKPSNKDAWIGRANTYSTLKQFDKALPDYDYYLELNPADAKAYMWRGTAYYNLGEFEKANTDLDKAIQMIPENDEPYYWKGVVAQSGKDYEVAEKFFSQSLSINPQRANAFSWRGIARFNTNRPKEAIEDYNKALQINPKDASAFINRSVAYKKLGNFKQAFADYKSAGDLGQPLSKAYFMEIKRLAGE